MLIEIVSNCAFSLELRRKKWQQWFRYNDILNFRMCSKRMKRQKKKDLLFGVHRFRSIFAFNKLDLYNSHSYLQRPKDSAALFFLHLRQNKSQYITCNFQSNKARYYWTLTTYQKKPFCMHRSLFKCLLSMNTHGCFFSICTPSSQTF